MKKKRWITICIVALVLLIACSIIRTGERIYQSSEGQRGWSLGAATYSLFGWDSSSYLADTASRWHPTDGDGLRFLRTRPGRKGPALFFVAALGVGGVFFYRRRRQIMKVDSSAK